LELVIDLGAIVGVRVQVGDREFDDLPLAGSRIDGGDRSRVGAAHGAAVVGHPVANDHDSQKTRDDEEARRDEDPDSRRSQP
jgi:hypothetical protein